MPKLVLKKLFSWPFFIGLWLVSQDLQMKSILMNCSPFDLSPYHLSITPLSLPLSLHTKPQKLFVSNFKKCWEGEKDLKIEFLFEFSRFANSYAVKNRTSAILYIKYSKSKYFQCQTFFLRHTRHTSNAIYLKNIANFEIPTQQNIVFAALTTCVIMS